MQKLINIELLIDLNQNFCS